MTNVLRAFFASSVVLLVLLALSLPYVTPGTATFTVTVLSLVMLLVILVGSAALIYLDRDPFEELT